MMISLLFRHKQNIDGIEKTCSLTIIITGLITLNCTFHFTSKCTFFTAFVPLSSKILWSIKNSVKQNSHAHPPCYIYIYYVRTQTTSSTLYFPNQTRLICQIHWINLFLVFERWCVNYCWHLVRFSISH